MSTNDVPYIEGIEYWETYPAEGITTVLMMLTAPNELLNRKQTPAGSRRLTIPTKTKTSKWVFPAIRSRSSTQTTGFGTSSGVDGLSSKTQLLRFVARSPVLMESQPS